MKRFHSTLSRRDFMKGLGLAGAGLGASAALAPAFQDLDELAGSYTKRHNWWVAEREFEDITTPIDWKVFQPYDNKANPAYSRSAETAAKLKIRDDADNLEGLTKKIPGRALRDFALADATNRVPTNEPWDGPASFTTPASRGVAPWDEGLENNLQTMRAAMHNIGCDKVGVIEVNEHMKRLFNKDVAVWEDIDTAFQDSKKVYHIPNKCKWILVWAPQQNYVQNLYALRADENYRGGLGLRNQLGSLAGGRAYGDASMIRTMATRFLKALGYQALKPTASANVPFGIFAGLSEQARTAFQCTPECGLEVRYADFAVTDFPMAPTKPIDFGLSKFCPDCIRCGEGCPTESISLSKETSWDTAVPMNRPGFKGWYVNWNTCIDFGSPGPCGTCHAICPFNHPSEGLIHPVVRAVAGNTGVFNKFFADMDRIFSYASPKSDEEMAAWWTRDFRTYKGDIIHGAGTYQW